MSRILITLSLFFIITTLHAVEKTSGNPFITHMYTADPSAHVFEGKVYVYPSHDKDNPDWFNMSDYHVFSSSDLNSWEDHGKALDVEDVPWATEYMWAPDCVYKDGTYYFYFPARDTAGDFRIGVATSPSPSGPFIAEEQPIKNSFSVDPSVFIDDDGEAYMFFGGDGEGGTNTPWIAKLDKTMKQFTEEPKQLAGVDYWFEASWIHKVDGVYYLTYSTGAKHPDHSTSAIAYATATNPYGPFTYKGVVNKTVSGWTNHHSTVEYKGQWYLFYHNSSLSGGITEQRSICADYLHFNEKGEIKIVEQTKTGVGSYNPTTRINAENYSETVGASKQESNDNGLHMEIKVGDTLSYTNINFSEYALDTITLNLFSKTGGKVTILSQTKEIIAETNILSSTTEDWNTIAIAVPTLEKISNIHILVSGIGNETISLNWLEFVQSTTSTKLSPKNSDNVEIFPNPATSEITINSLQKGDITLMNRYGKVIKKLSLGVNSINNLSNSVYFVVIKENGKCKVVAPFYKLK